MFSNRISAARLQRAFSLIELIVVLIVASILAVVALPRLDFSSFKEVGINDSVKAALEYARRSAIAQRRFACATIASTGVTLTIERAIPEATAGGCPVNALGLPSAISSCGGANIVCAPSGVSITSTTALPATIIFDPEGRPSASITLTVGAMPAFTLEAGSGHVH